MIIIADGHELPIGAGHRNERTSGTPQHEMGGPPSPVVHGPKRGEFCHLRSPAPVRYGRSPLRPLLATPIGRHVPASQGVPMSAT